MEKEKPKFIYYGIENWGIENWQNLRDLINTSDEAYKRFRKTLAAVPARFCFVQDNEQNLYIILEEDREDFLTMLQMMKEIKATLLSSSSPNEIEKECWFFHPGGEDGCIYFEGTEALVKARDYFKTRWEAFKVTGSPFDYTFTNMLHIKDRKQH